MSNVQKDRILEGAEELFFKAGIRSVTMDEIARHLGMSKKTIYQYYRDKDDIVSALVQKKLEEDKEEMCGIGIKSSNVMEEMITMMKHSEDFFSRVNPIVIHDLQKYYPEAWQFFQRFKADVVIDSMQDILDRGIVQGYVREDIDTKAMARMRVWQIELGFDNSVFPHNEFNSWKVQLQFLEHFIYGICTAKGHEILNQYKNILEHN
ncbi:TetR/AcrR family transcriptional regulator [Mucilaginibacter paludis]|uniref:Transcriptional regulator, TetR family n=1 Tax=Mucilaginibacter paludis DSM 18603 TaxID=714943 RepID=H1Y7K3_9SPHI|nr:TetR/AcrR family transcriptional regulator [Mucilaginibacter paludis]EHQ29424.1 transcriptional regulator, TetR family [Mucilaginibacter paludis DSM 18603]